MIFRSTTHRQAGASLIEILVSVLIIALGILAMAAVQSNAIRFQKTTEYRAIATMLAADLADRMRANEVGAIGNLYSSKSTSYANGKLTATNQGTLPVCGTVSAAGVLSPCTVAEIRNQDIYQWRLRTRMTLPGASVHIRDIQQGAIEFWIAWTEADNVDASGNSRAPQSAECPKPPIWTAEAGDPEFHCVFLRVAL